MPQRWHNEPGEMEFTMEVDYKTSGYYDPGCISATPENDYPPEGECEATLVEMKLNGKAVEKELADRIFELLYEAIEEETQLEPPEYDPPERD